MANRGTGRESPRVGNTPDAQALWRLTSEHYGGNRAAAARATGIPYQTFYSVLSGVSGLGRKYAEALRAVHHDFPLAGPLAVETAERRLTIRSQATVGVYRKKFNLPDEEQRAVKMDLSAAEWALNPFGVIVRRPGAEGIYCDGTVLACISVDVSAPDQRVSQGQRLIVQRIGRGGRLVEVTVREVELIGGGVLLNARRDWNVAKDGEYINRMSTLWLANGQKVGEFEGDRYSIAGAVIHSSQPEGRAWHPGIKKAPEV